MRVEHLAKLRPPTLVVQGTRDPLGSREEVEAYVLAPSIRVVWLEDGDHSFKPRAKSGHTLPGHMEAAIEAVADFIVTR